MDNFYGVLLKYYYIIFIFMEEDFLNLLINKMIEIVPDEKEDRNSNSYSNSNNKIK